MKREREEISGATDGLSLSLVPPLQADPGESRDRSFISDDLAGRDQAGTGSVAGNQTPATPTLPRWKQERIRRLNKIFVSAERRIANGKRVTKAFKHFAWWLKSKPRFYRCDPARCFRLSEKRLIQLFYAWRKRGQEALILKYRSGYPKIAPDEVQKFAMACVEAGVVSLRQAHATMINPVASPHGFRHALLGKKLEAITQLLAARRTAIRLEKRARKILEGKR